jgi:hypothetical protein
MTNASLKIKLPFPSSPEHRLQPKYVNFPFPLPQNIALDAADSETLPILLSWIYGQKEKSAELIQSEEALKRVKYLAKVRQTDRDRQRDRDTDRDTDK